jgi:hypothetical protein
MPGTGGDDFICGHCGDVMLEDFDRSTIKGNPVYQCGFVKTTMTSLRREWSPLVLTVIHVGDPFSRGKKNRKAKA